MALPGEATLSDTYGGPYTNEHPVEDPTTEVDAAALNEMAADTSAMTRTTPRAWMSFVGVAYSGSGTDVVAVADHNANWGGAVAVKPTVGQSATGVYLITWPATVVDELGISHSVNIRYPHQPMTVGPTIAYAQITAMTANTMTLKTFNAGGAANALAGVSIFVAWT